MIRKVEKKATNKILRFEKKGNLFLGEVHPHPLHPSAKPLWLLYKITENNCHSRLCDEFIQTQKKYFPF